MHFSSYGPVSNVSFFWVTQDIFPQASHSLLLAGTGSASSRTASDVEAVLHPQSPPGKGSGPKPWPAGAGRFFSWKSTSFLSVRWFLFLGESSLALEYHTVIIFSTITLFFVLIYIFSVLRQRAGCCGFCPAVAGVPTCIPICQTFIKMRWRAGSA